MVKNKMYGVAKVIPIRDNFITGEINIAATNNIPGEIIIDGPINKMYGSATVVLPPRKNVIITEIKDTYVDSSHPTMNYGSRQVLYLGNDKSIFQIMLGFNLDNIPKDVVITKAFITMTCYDQNIPINIKLYEALTPWQENDITHYYKPDKGKLISENNITIGSTAKLDIKNYVQDYSDNLNDNNGIILSTNDVITKSFFSKESSYSPSVSIEYYDPNVKSLNTSTLQGEIYLGKKNTTTLQSEIIVEQIYGAGQNDLVGEINIINPYIRGEVNVVFAKEIEGNIFVKHISETIINAETNIINPFFNGEVTVAFANDIQGDIVIYHEKLSSIDGEINIVNPYFNGEIIVARNKDINGEITIVSNKESIIDGEINIINPYFNGEITVAKRNELSGEMLVVHKKHSSISADTNIINPFFNGEINIAIANDIQGEIIVGRIDKNAINSEVIIGRKALFTIPAEVSIGERNEIESETYIINPFFSGEIYVSKLIKTDTLGEILVCVKNDIIGEINITATNKSNLLGEISITKITNKTVSGEVIVKTIYNTNEILGEITLEINKTFSGYVYLM